MSLLDQPKPPKKIEGARVIRKLNMDKDEPVCRSFPKQSSSDRRGYGNRKFNDDQVREIRRRFARYLRLNELVATKYPGGTRRMKNKRAVLRHYILHRYGPAALGERFHCSKEAIYGIASRLSYGDVD